MIEWKTVLTSLIGSGILSIATVKGLSGYLASRWTARYKNELDKELESYRDTLVRRRNRIESELGHRTYITKAQFDMEFNALKDCFSVLGRLRIAFNGMRPVLDWTPRDNEEKLKVVATRLELFKRHYNPFIDVTEGVRPFIPEDINEQFETCAKMSFLEIRHIEEDLEKALSVSGYQEGLRNHDLFSAAYSKASQLTRRRFRELAVIPEIVTGLD